MSHRGDSGLLSAQERLYTYMKGSTAMQSREKIAWNNEGALHAQVEFH